jgi:hypothetical protein
MAKRTLVKTTEANIKGGDTKIKEDVGEKGMNLLVQKNWEDVPCALSLMLISACASLYWQTPACSQQDCLKC